MNNWHNEFMAEYHRRDILKDVEYIRLEKLALESRGNCPTLFERLLLTLANWMISKGRQLRKRYEAPTLHCGKSPTRSFAN